MNYYSRAFCEENQLLVMILSSLSQKIKKKKKKSRFVPVEAVNSGAWVPCCLKDHHTSTPTFYFIYEAFWDKQEFSASSYFLIFLIEAFLKKHVVFREFK